MKWFRNLEQDRFCIKTIFNLVFVFFLYMLLGNLSWSQSAATAIRPDNPESVLLPIQCIELVVQTALFCFVLWLYATKVLKRESDYFRISFRNIRMKWVLAGLLAPMILVGIYLLFFPGSFEQGTLGIFAGIAMTFLHGGLKAGVTEEILFRGFYMKLFENRWNRTVAILLNSFLFAFIHLGNASELGNIEMVMMLLAYTAAGVTFSIITYREYGVGNAILMHALWNIIAESNLLCIITSPNQYDANAIWNYRLHEIHPLLGGGFFGISASVLAALAFLSPLLLIRYGTKLGKANHG